MYAIYLRKSRADVEAEARGEGESLARHRAALLELAARRGYAIGHVYEEIVSGDTIAARPAMQQLLADVEAGRWEGVLVVEVERLARGDSIDQGLVAQTFKYANTLIVTPSKTFNPNDEADEEYFEFGLFMARREYKTIKRRLQAGRVASVKEGKYMGTRPVFGYARVKLEGQKGWSLRPVPEEADAVRMAFDLYLHGESGRSVGANEIANRFNAMGLHTFGGHRFTADGIRKILQNPAYVGMVRWNQRTTVKSFRDGERVSTRPKCNAPLLVQGLHPAIVSRDTFDAVHEIFAARRKPPIHSGKPVRNPLNGLIRCAECGYAVILSPSYRVMADGNKEEPYYRCSNVRCSSSRIGMHYVIDAVLDVLENWYASYSANNVEPPRSETPRSETARAQIRKQLESLYAQRDRLRDFLEQAVYDIPTYVERNGVLQERIAATEDALSKIPEDEPSIEDSIRAVVPRLRAVIDGFAGAPTPADQNALLRSVVSRVVYHKTGRVYRGQDPSKLLSVDVFPVTSDSHSH